MKKIFLTLAVFVMALCASAQKNQYFWYQGNLMMGNPIAQIDSVTFGEGEPTDTLHIMLPRTIIKTVHDTMFITIHDTICPNTEHNGFRYVDLGLSVMWADANVGADSPEDYGWYLAWGETEQSTDYGDYYYKHGQHTTMYKYGTMDGLSRLLPEDDAASVNMGGNWRTPTREEWMELLNNCNISLDTINTHPGYRFTASNGNSIFIPRAGSIWGNLAADLADPNDNTGRDIACWSSDMCYGDNDCEAYAVTNDNNGPLVFKAFYRAVGFSVRGVFKK